jgi:zinc transport system ATP-binding protein
MTLHTPHTHVTPASDLGLHQARDVVCLHGVSFGYGAQLVLENVTLHVKRGSVLGIIGPNGGGKSTLLKLMMGLLRPQVGRVEVLGRTPEAVCRAGTLVGYLPQRLEMNTDFPITVRQLVELGLIKQKPFGWGFTRAQKQQVMETLELVDMADFARRPIGALSGGQQQRVLLARALVTRPELLLLDEPTTALDQPGQERFAGLIERLRQTRGLTLVMVAHDLRAVMASCDRVACVNRTLHYHDRPAGLSRELLFKVFQCDYDAVAELAPHEGCCGPVQITGPLWPVAKRPDDAGGAKS